MLHRKGRLASPSLIGVKPRLMLQREGKVAPTLPWSPYGIDAGPRKRRTGQDTDCVRRRRLDGGLHGIQQATASPVFYFSSIMVANTKALATDSLLSTYLASISICMARPQAREAWYDAASSTVATLPMPPCSPPARHSSSSWPEAASCYTTRRLGAATGSVKLGERGGAACCLARIRRARGATQPACMPENCSPEAIKRVVKEEMGEWRRGCDSYPMSGLV